MGDVIFVGLIILYLIFLIILQSLFDSVFEYKNYLMLKSILKISFPFFLTIISIASCFIIFEYWITYLAFIMFGVLSLGYFIFDSFYVQQKEKEYISFLQNKCLIRMKIKDIFDVQMTNASYEAKVLVGGIFGCSITNSEYGECIQMKSTENTLLLIPKKYMSQAKMKFCIKQLCLNCEDDMIGIYPEDFSDDVYEKYIFWHSNKVYGFLKTIKKSKMIKIAVILFYAIIILIGVLIGLEQFGVIDLRRFINSRR